MICIQFATDGTGRAVYTEELPLAELGSLSMTRASSVEYNETTQQWDVRLTSNPDQVAYSDKSRNECIKWEVNKLNEDLIMGN